MKWLLIVSIICFFSSIWRVGLVAGIFVQCAFMTFRGLSLGRLPLLGPHDTMVFFSLAIAVVGLILSLSSALRSAAWLRTSTGVAAGLVTLGALLFPSLNIPLPQILNTFWFELHVVLAFLAYALLAAGGVMCAAFLILGRRAYLDAYYKIILTGWFFFSTSMIAGGIWGYYAWGTFWLWTPKELWTTILWLFYSMALHVRLKGGAWERCSAWLGIIGVSVMLFTYLGVSLLMKSSHSF